MTKAERQALLRKRSEVGVEIRRLADLGKDPKHTWGAEDDAAWKKANAEYDQHTDALGRGERAAQVARDERDLERIVNVPEGIMPAGNDYANREARDRRGTATGIAFRDVSSGLEVRAFRHGESMHAARRRELEDDDAPRFDGDSVGRALGYWLAGHAQDLSAEERIALIGGMDGSGGFFLSPEASGIVIDFARAASVVSAAGAQSVPMAAREMTLAKVTNDPTATWRDEGVPLHASDISVGQITLRARTLGAVVPVALELLEDAANVGGVVKDALTKAIAGELDRVALLGSGAGAEPRGIRFTPGIQAETGIAVSLASYASFSKAVAKVLQENFPGPVSSLAWLAHPIEAGRLDLLRDEMGQPLQPSPWTAQLKRLYTSTLEYNSLVEGCIGDFSQVLIGMRSQIRIQAFDAGNVLDAEGNELNAITQLYRYFRAYIRADIAVMRAPWLCWTTGAESL